MMLIKLTQFRTGFDSLVFNLILKNRIGTGLQMEIPSTFLSLQMLATLFLLDLSNCKIATFSWQIPSTSILIKSEVGDYYDSNLFIIKDMKTYTGK